MFPPLLVQAATHAYPIHLGSGLLKGLGATVRQEAFAAAARTCAVVTDDRVAPLYAPTALASLREAGFSPALVTVPAGEASKSLARVEEVCGQLAEAGLDRHGFVLALGGGVVGDLAGFAASVYYRGIPFVQVPTTVVAQVDSSVGGKTGVNLPAAKNLVGAFHPPALVVADVDTLDTLPDREFNEGMAEAIKHAVIRDHGLLGRLLTLDRCDRAALTAVVRRNLEIKAEVVARDEFETDGTRALLNFGHTVGHAIEQSAGYSRLLHGEAISLGMVAAARLSARKAGLPAAHYEEILRALAHYHLPTTLPADVSTETALASMARDKKFRAGTIRFVLTPQLGQAFLSEPGLITWEDLQQELAALRPG